MPLVILGLVPRIQRSACVIAWKSTQLNQLGIQINLICLRKKPPIEVRVFRAYPVVGRRADDHESIEVHGRAEGIHHPSG
jgi:hypothetical protein